MLHFGDYVDCVGYSVEYASKVMLAARFELHTCCETTSCPVHSHMLDLAMLSLFFQSKLCSNRTFFSRLCF